MKRFVWRLQRVLDVKEKAEQIRRSELMQLTEQIASTRAHLLDEKRIIRETMMSIKEKQTGKRLSDQALFLRHVFVNDERIIQLQKRITELERQQQQKAQEVMELRHARERLEKLKEQAKTRYELEFHKAEQKDLDERAILSYGRRDH